MLGTCAIDAGLVFELFTPPEGVLIGDCFVAFEVQGGGAAGGSATGAAAGDVSVGAPGTSRSYAKAKLTAAQ